MEKRELKQLEEGRRDRNTRREEEFEGGERRRLWDTIRTK
jgi:hypothetical protein